MKRNLFSLAAIAIALVTFAFTAPIRFADTYVFEYQQSNFDELQVETEANWTLVQVTPDAPTMCVSEDEKACRIAAPIESTELVLGVRKLKSIVNIQSSELNNIGYVTSVTGTGVSYSNKFQ